MVRQSISSAWISSPTDWPRTTALPRSKSNPNSRLIVSSVVTILDSILNLYRVRGSTLCGTRTETFRCTITKSMRIARLTIAGIGTPRITTVETTFTRVRMRQHLETMHHIQQTGATCYQRFWRRLKHDNGLSGPIKCRISSRPSRMMSRSADIGSNSYFHWNNSLIDDVSNTKSDIGQNVPTSNLGYLVKRHPSDRVKHKNTDWNDTVCSGKILCIMVNRGVFE